MKIGGEDYKKKYILLEIDYKTDQGILIDALKGHIEKLAKDIETYSKGEHNVDRIRNCAERMTKCMEWRDHIELMGTDILSLRDFDYYKNGIERFY
jgi:hypothetical protein